MKSKTARRLIPVLMFNLLLLAFFLWKNSSEVPLPEGISSEVYESVRNSLKKDSGTEPTHAEVLFLLAKSLEAQDNLDSAERCYEAVPKDDSNYGFPALLELGKLQIPPYVIDARLQRNISPGNVQALTENSRL